MVPFPQWDVDGACGKLPPYAAKPCVETEQASYETLKGEWVRMTDAQRDMAKTVGSAETIYRCTAAHGLAKNLLEIDENSRPVHVPRFRR